tara:strand:- start:12113 stop:12514 length:402 start_codon:yes stop_codon:yes gene_type:complete
MSDWDMLSSGSESRETSRMIEDYENLVSQRDELDDKIKRIEKQIIADFPEDFGEHSRVVGNKVLTINRQERYTWNQDLLHKIYQDEEIPDHVKRRLTVDKRVFQRLDPEQQAPLLPALTRNPGPVSIKVTRSD